MICSEKEICGNHGEPMKILCVCVGGNCRSVTLAYMLKYHYGHDALAVGIEGNTPDTVRMLGDWAEKIITVEEGIKESLPLSLQDKTVLWNVGPDRWFNPPGDLMGRFQVFLDNME